MRQEANRHRHDLNLLPKTFVLSADKSNCVVVMDKQQYHDKALSLLNDKSTYAVLNLKASDQLKIEVLTCPHDTPAIRKRF